MDKVKIICLGGQDELYKLLTVVEVNDDIYVIDCGVKFPDKSKPGIDYIIPRYDYLVENKSKVKAYILTHGHDSVIGALPYIYEKVPAPIYCSNTTKIFFEGFCKHNHLDYSKYPLNIVKPSDDLLLGNRLIRLFGTASNFVDSFGVAIPTDQGNIVFISNFVIHNNFNKGFIHDVSKILKICEKPTLALMVDSTYAERTGYCSPNYSFGTFAKQEMANAPGRIFIAIDTPDLYNIIGVLNHAVMDGKKVIPYDDSTRELILDLIQTGYIDFKKDTLCSIEDVNRIRPQELVIIMSGFGNALNSKIALLGSRNNDDKIIFLKPDDTFVFANHVSFTSESSQTDALDEVYHNDCHILRLPKAYSKMHGCEEDIKTMIALFRPKYYIPITGSFKSILANAKIAINMNVGLSHNNIFVIDNGHVVEIENGLAKVLPNKVVTGDVFIDGKGIGDIEDSVLEERQRFSDDGVIILALTISSSTRKIVAGPDVQARGLMFIKESEALLKELSNLFSRTVENELAKEVYSIKYIEEAVKDITFKAIRRSLNKTPIIIPVIAEIK